MAEPEWKILMNFNKSPPSKIVRGTFILCYNVLQIFLALIRVRKHWWDDINKVADIWLDTNIKAHNFIPAEYWKSNFKSVKEALLLAEVYVYEYDTEIQGFIGLNDEYVEGIFVSGEMQSQGIGKILLNYAKDKRNKLLLNVYQKNARAISFYKREGFEIQHSGLDEATGEKDYVMTWQHKQKFKFGELRKSGFIRK